MLLLLGACGDSTSPPVPARLEISPKTLAMNALGLSQQFTVRVEDEKGDELEGFEVQWSTDDPLVASVSSSGLVTGLARGVAKITVEVEGLSDQATLNVNPLPAEVLKTGGDAQVGALKQVLPAAIQVETRDSNGNPLAGVTVYFAVASGEGSVTPSSSETDALGQASAKWTLGCTAISPQELMVSAGSSTVRFSALPDLSLPAICQTVVPDGRVTLDYSGQIEVAGPSPDQISWDLEGGTLPPGISLFPDGLLKGTPTEAGTFTFRARVLNLTGASDSGEFQLKVCEAPLALAPGETISLQPIGSGECGIFIPSGAAGDRYRLGVVWPSFDEQDWMVLPSVTITARKETLEGPEAQATPETVEGMVRDPWELVSRLPDVVKRTLRKDAANVAFQNSLRKAERAMFEALGPDVRPLPEIPPALRTSGSSTSAPEKITLFSNGPDPENPMPGCSFMERVTALKIAENDQMVIYQDSAQNAVDSLRVNAGMAQMMLDYYRDYGKPVIDTYFGGVSDIDGDDRVAVFVTPAVVIGVAYVRSGDFLPTTACANSNQMELVRFDAATIRGLESGNYHALATLTHEVKHVSSLYKRLVRSDDLSAEDTFHPDWVEEGGAEIASEMSSRLAWEAIGGPAVGQIIDGEASLLAYDPDGNPLPETYGLNVLWGRAVLALGSQPNALVNTPRGAQAGHSVYGSGWHFHRWLGDAYGSAATRLADGSLFSQLVDPLSASGAQGIQDLTGRSWKDLTEEYLIAVMLNGTGGPEGSRGFTSYDFPDVTEGLKEDQRPGLYPWPVNLPPGVETAPFESFMNTGTVGASGLRILDLTSDGTGLGLDVKVESTQTPLGIILVRIR